MAKNKNTKQEKSYEPAKLLK